MSTMIQQRQINNNIKTVINFLDTQFPCCWDDLEQDIEMGYTDIHREINNMRNALGVLKIYHKEDKKRVTIINKYLQILSKER